MKARNMLRDTVRNAGPVKRHAVTTESRFEDALARMAAIRAGLPYFELKGLDPDDVARPDLDGCPPEIVEEHVAAAPAAGERIRFTDIISPFSTEEFFARRHAHPHPLLLHGPSGRFGSLVEWKDLDDLICRGRLKAHDLRLVLDGTHIPPNLFSMVPYGRSTRQLEQVPPVVDDRKLVSFLRQGATLIVDRIHGHLPAVADLGHAFETALHNYALVNLYVSWQATRGFATHWDGHDVFVLQVRGEKRWYLYGPTRRSPTSEDTTPARSAPGTPVWEGTLRPGDVFFVPRGWWHDARMSSAQGGAGSIHLTCHVRPVTGQHLLVWLGGKLAQHELFRKDVPLMAGESELARYLEEFKALIESVLHERTARELKDNYRRRWTDRSGTRFGPWIEPWKSPEWDRYGIVLRGFDQAALRGDGGNDPVLLEADGRTHTMDPRCLALVRPLAEREDVTVGALKAVDPDTFGAGFVDDFLRMLIKDAIVDAVPPLPPRAGD